MAQPREGDLLDGRYRIGATIARGGMSTVYRATDLRLGRDVAAKVMDPRFVDDVAFRTRFEREARAIAKLHDESLVDVYDQGTDAAGHVFLIMELVDGGTLRELLRERGPMPPHAAVAVLRPVLRALSLAHKQGLVHRDIKPENVLISTLGKVKLADFGLVRAAADAKVTSSSVIIGTVAYLSPEQVTGEHVDASSDVYSAGVLLFELLTGTTPFTGDASLGIALKRLHEDVPQPSEYIDGVPEEFDQLIARACARQPGDRFADATEFSDAIEAVSDFLALPPFTVPAPADSAASRAAAADTATEVSPTGSNNQAWAETNFISPPGTAALPHRPPQRPPVAPPPTHPRENEAYRWQSESGPSPVPNSEYGRQSSPAPTTYSKTLEQHPTEHPLSIRGNAHPGRRQTRRPGRQRTRRGFALWLIIALVATFGMGLGAWWLGSGRYGEVPSIIGLSQPQAIEKIENAGFAVTTQEEYDNNIPKAQVIGTNPLSGQRSVRGEPVALVISLGRPTVPALPADRSTDAFSKALFERTLIEVSGEAEYSDSVPAGSIASTSPASGETVLVGSTVEVRLSKGPAPVKVPDVLGLAEKSATKQLKQAGLSVRAVEKKFAPDAAADSVLAVSPGVGTGLAKGSEVTLTLNNGIEVPDIVGLTDSAAKKRLESAGISVSEIKKSDSTQYNYGEVISSNPEAGKTVNPENPTVTLVISDTVDVPSLLGKRVDDARKEAEQRHLALDVPADAGGSDLIYWQSPRSGQSVRAGTKISVRAL